MRAISNHTPEAGKVCQLLAASLAGQWRRYRKWLRRCQKQLSEAAVHQLRIEARRLPASLELLGTLAPGRPVQKAQRLLKEHLDTFDELRDLHVQLLLVGPWTRRYAAAQDFQGHLRKREKRCAKRLRRRVQHLRTGRLGQWLAGCVEQAVQLAQSQSGRDLDAKVLGAVHEAFDQVRELEARIRRSQPATIHRARIAFKQYRYMMVALALLFPRLTEKQRARMHAYQTVMGNIQDLEVLIASIEAFARNRSSDAQAVARFRAALQRRQQALITRYLKMAAKLESFHPELLLRRLSARGTHRRFRHDPGGFKVGPRNALVEMR